ncbi:hypothetical protein fugu_019565 [Takifugu bimaculatus]|uniref:Uncharacterized protein n=1 Tax=Takifugu bimaculatus TaxID=433685 RepID=A0A4Z2BJR8_9TELE|nr:hypothetical protein fugu_019565 [Takifugu bimaculatus]
MGDVVSSHLDESRREIITARSREVMQEFSSTYEQQYAVALFNSVRFEIEGGGGPQSQLLHRKDPLAGPLHLLRKSLSVLGRKSEMEESVCVRAKQLRHQTV